MKITIISPVYNCERYLSECIDSVLNQTYTNWELILVNDGSNDNSLSIIESYAQNDSRIKYISQENQGQAAARNKALDISSGDLITFLDADDYYYKENTLQDCIRIFQDDPKIDCIQIPVKQNNQERNKLSTLLSEKKKFYDFWINKNKILTNYLCDKIFKKQIWDNIRLPQGQIFEDRYIFPILLENISSIKLTNKGGYFYRTHENQTVRRKADHYFIDCSVKANNQILKHSFRYNHSAYIRIYSECIHLCKIAENPIKIPKYMLSIKETFQAKVPFGLKIQMLKAILGIYK